MAKKNKKSIEIDVTRLNYAFQDGLGLLERTIQLTGGIEPGCTFDFIDAALNELERISHEPITIKVNSDGGSTYEALAIVGRIRNSPAPIITEGYGKVMSAATLVLASGDVRKCSEFCTFMHHESSYAAGGKHSEIKDLVSQIEREEKLWANWMESFTTQPADFWLDSGVRKDFYFDANQALSYGLVDEIF